MLQAPRYLRRVDHHWKIRARKQRTDIGNRSITDWNQLPEGAIRTSHGKTHIFKTRVRKVQNSGGSEGDKKKKVKAREVKGCELYM
jgi:hypothetical protein